MSLKNSIEQKILNTLTPTYYEVINESHMHSGPATESHFKLIIVSHRFNDESLLNRHRMINNLLNEELNNGVHALALHLFTQDEWEKNPQAKPSPNCKGGS